MSILRVKTHFSLLDGLSKPEQIAKRIVELGLEGCALTDHSSISGTIKFIQEMKKVDKKPIIGCELYVSSLPANIKDNELNRALSHLLVLARNDSGYKQLVKLISYANHPDHFYYKPRLSLEQYSEFQNGDLVFISGHLGSNISKAIEEDKADYTVSRMIELFGKDNFFLETQLIFRDDIPQVIELTDKVRQLGIKHNIKIVATPDAHFCSKIDSFDHKILLCRNLGKTLEQVQASGTLSGFFSSDNFHIPETQELLDCGHSQEELENTNYVALLCSEYTDIIKQPSIPEFVCPEGYDPDSWVRQLCREGWKAKIANKIPKEQHQAYGDRVKEELSALQGAGLSSYFLIVADILAYCRKNGWLVGPGRGSAAGCMVSYLMNITAVDPIMYNLLFARFWNAGRSSKDKVSYPDIDIDIPASKREQIIEYIKEKYGHDRVAHIVSFQTMKGRGALKDVIKAYGGVSFEEMNNITKNFPQEASIAGELQLMKEQNDGESSIILWTVQNDDKGHLKEWCFAKDDGSLDGPLSKRFEQAARLEGVKINKSTHAAGIVISPKPISEMCPMMYDDKSNSMICGYEMSELEAAGLIKLDLLGLSLLDKLMGIQNILQTGEIV